MLMTDRIVVRSMSNVSAVACEAAKTGIFSFSATYGLLLMINAPNLSKKKVFLVKIPLMMNTMISCCGLNCEQCEAYLAWKNNDDALRQETAEKWKVQYDAKDITPEMINCSGCRREGPKIGHWSACQIRLCAEGKSYEHCGSCDGMDSCDLVSHVHKFSPEAKQNLLNLQ